MRDRAVVAADPGVREDETYLTIRLTDGRELGKHVEHAAGSLEKPTGDPELKTKFRGLIEGILSPAPGNNLIRLCREIEALRDVSVLARASAGRA